MKTENLEQLEQQIGFILKLANGCDLEMLKSIEKDYKNDFHHYEAVGILDGNPTYYEKTASKKAYYDRIKAIRNLVEVLNTTDKNIIRA